MTLGGLRPDMADTDPGGDPDDRTPEADDSPDDPAVEGAPEEPSDGWRFGLDEVDEEGIVRPAIEPGRPDPEHVLFVVLGAIATVLVFFRLWTLTG